MSTSTRTVGKAAQAAGLTPKAVRLYEARGLLPEAERTEAGYRTYTDDDITVLRFIGQAKTLGLSLAEIRDVDHTLTELRQLRLSLADTRATAQDRMQDGDAVCGIIQHAR